jgi:hypothetical protein
MPKNRVIYFGLLLVAASALLWLGALLARFILDSGILPWAGGAGVLLIIIGMIIEARKPNEPAAIGAGETEATGVASRSNVSSGR